MTTTPRFYNNTSVPQTLAVSVLSTDTTFTVGTGGTTTYPNPPFLLGLDRGTSTAEVCLCTAVPTSTTFTVIRGYDHTTAQAHAATTGTVEHCSSAIEFIEANAFINLLTTKGDFLSYSGSTNAAVRVGVGTDGSLITADSTQNAGVRWGNDILLSNWNELLISSTAGGGTATCDLSQAREFSIILNAAPVIITFANAPSVANRRTTFGIALIQDGTGTARTVTWPASVDWGVIGAPTLTNAANAVDFVGFVSDNNGTRWRGFAGGFGFGG